MNQLKCAVFKKNKGEQNEFTSVRQLQKILETQVSVIRAEYTILKCKKKKDDFWVKGILLNRYLSSFAVRETDM